jgi:tRNA 5-methylaminomethyl-2-thiouridine biosynthesis bifunctional protein
LAETRHVFLDGNGLPEAWADFHGEFVVAETGFGTGLNFLATWKLFEDTAPAGARLHFISFEKHPLEVAVIREALAPWAAELPDFLSYYPAGGAVSPRVRLTLAIGDVNAELPKLDTRIDCWFLDGFKPSTNPAMWSETVFENMARLSKNGTSFATFTAAGFVRRGLEAAGFSVSRIPGFGRKREMLAGVFSKML